MRIWADCLRLTTRLTACFSAGVLAVLCGNAWAATENVWQGASGGAWATGANWSLGHAPTASECAVLPDTRWRFSPEGVDVSVTGITSTSELPVVTTVEQSLAQPNAASWRAKDGIVAVNGAVRYELPSNAQVRIEERSGSWRRHMGSMPDQRATGRVFEITVPHGVKPSAASCAWRVRPCALSVP